jgi:hypothetical protein
VDSKGRLEELANMIARRSRPLGKDFSSDCWGAVAEQVALDHGQQPCDYFHFSQDLYEAAIRVNSALPETQRNSVMRDFTRALAATAPTA